MSEERTEVERGDSFRGLDRLLELQDIDMSTARLEARRAELEGGEELRSARAGVMESEARVGELRLALDAVSTEQRRLENDTDSIPGKIDAERARL